MHDINSESGTKADIEKEMKAIMLIKMLRLKEVVWQNALRHSLLVAVYVLQDRLF